MPTDDDAFESRKNSNVCVFLTGARALIDMKRDVTATDLIETVPDRWRILICEPEPLMAAGLEHLLGAGAIAVAPEVARSLARTTDTAVVVCSVVHEADWDRLSRLTSPLGAPPVVALLDIIDPPSIEEALSRGAASVCSRHTTTREIVAIVHAAASGARVVPACEIAGHPVPCRWSEDEVAWLRSLARGASIDELACEYGYSRRTMFRRLSALYRRLGSDRQAPALATAGRLGLIR